MTPRASVLLYMAFQKEVEADAAELAQLRDDFRREQEAEYEFALSQGVSCDS